MDNEIKDELLSQIDIVDVISSYGIELIQKKDNPDEYMARCPFHKDGKEKHPSFSVSKSKQVYNCWTCGDEWYGHGNAVTFVKKKENVDGSEARRILAERNGIKLSSRTYSSSHVKTNNSSNNYTKYARIYEMYEWVHKYFINNMSTSYAKKAKEYLTNRTIGKDIIKDFKIGLSLNSKDDLINKLKEKGYTLEELNNFGLAKESRDVFNDRIMFPLYDLNGKIVAFSGRRYDGIKDNKYVNTKDTEIFKKGNLLYNYHNAAKLARGKDEIIVMEGFMAVIRSMTVGIGNCVALMSKNMSDEQARLASELSKNVIVSFDGDEPGRAACLNNGEKLEALGCNVRVVELSDGLDPDDYILKYGADSFKDLINNAISLSEYRIKRYKMDKNLDDEKELSKYIDMVLSEILKEEDEIIVIKRLQKLEKEVNIEYNILEMRLSKLRKEKNLEEIKRVKKVEEAPKKPKMDKYSIATYSLLYYMITNKLCLEYYNKGKINFIREIDRFLASEIAYYDNQHNGITLADFVSYIEEKEELNKVFSKCLSLKDKGIIKEDVTEDEINSYINTLKEYQINREIKKLDDRIKEEIDEAKQIELALKIAELKSKL